jgi:GTPase SAR1 family protein
MNNYLHIIYKSVRDLCSRMKDDKTDNKEPRYKIILVGDVNVGKTALFWQYT